MGGKGDNHCDEDLLFCRHLPKVGRTMVVQHFKGPVPVRKIKSALTAAKNGNSQRDSTLWSPQLNASNVK